MPGFKNKDSYAAFRFEVAREWRYVLTPQAREFLNAIASTCKTRLGKVKKGKRLWRAQLGNEWRDAGLFSPNEAIPLPPPRMKPLADRAVEGRVNSKGIPSLYLSTTEHAAMSESRPWIGALVTLATFETVRPLTLVDCSVLYGQHLKLHLRQKSGIPASPELINDIVWSAIDNAFSEPVTRADDTAEYAATQIIAEVFRQEGYDGVAYKSAFGEDGYSVALFNLADANQVDSVLYETGGAEFKFGKYGSHEP
jgi:hypothetical protein